MKHLVLIALLAALVMPACTDRGRSSGGDGDDDNDGDDGDQTWCELYAESKEECGGTVDAGFVDECESGLEEDEDYWDCFSSDCDEAETCEEILDCGISC